MLRTLVPVISGIYIGSFGIANAEIQTAAFFEDLTKNFFNCKKGIDGKSGCFWDKTARSAHKVIFNTDKTDVSQSVIATRLFAGPTQYPPQSFAAYGIVAFRSRATEFDLGRHKAICGAYVSTIPHESESSVPTTKQMATVWPIESDSRALKINKAPRSSVCRDAIASYGLTIAQQAIKRAEAASIKLDGVGPFLLAWSPPSTMGKPDAVVLYSNLSNVTSYEQAQPIFQRWANDIEQNPDLWLKGWNVEGVRLWIRRLLDDHGPSLAGIFGLKE